MALRPVPHHRQDRLKESLLDYLTQSLWVNPEAPLSLPLVLKRIVSQYGERPALSEKQNGSYQHIRYREFAEQSRCVAAALISWGLAPQGRVALLLKNSPVWPLADFGTLSVGATTVPIYPTLKAEAIAYILKDSESELLIVENKAQLEKITPQLCDTPALKRIIVRDPQDVELSDFVMSFEDLLSFGRQQLPQVSDEIEARIAAIKRDDVASIVYTSGTTGVPKGAMLTHLNFLSTVFGIISVTDCNCYDRFLSILPLSHVFERSFGYYSPIFCGASVAYAEGIETISKNFLEVRPTICAAVPRIFERIYTRLNSELKKGPAWKRRIFYWAEGVGQQVWDVWNQQLHEQESYHDARFRHRADQPAEPVVDWGKHPLLYARFCLARALVYRKFRKKFGGSIRYFVTGGAPLNIKLIKFFRNLQILIYEGYGLTETSPVVSFNYGSYFKPGTVGKLPNHVNVRLSAESEILIKGPNVMKGYLNKPEATQRAIDTEGWFHTGDVGTWDEDNFLKITDRIKELIVLSTGKNVPPLPLEQKIVQSELVSHVAVVGNNRKYIAALIFPDVDELMTHARASELSEEDLIKLCQSPQIRSWYAKLVQDANNTVSNYEQIKRFEIVPYDLNGDTELLTPTLKLKRKQVETKFSDLMTRLYPRDSVLA